MTSGDGSSCPKKRNVARGATNVADPSARSKPIMNRFCSRTRSSRPTSAAPYRTLRAVLDAAREQVASACARLAAEGLVVGTAGNVSVRVDDHIVVTPTGGVLGAMEAADMAGGGAGGGGGGGGGGAAPGDAAPPLPLGRGERGGG